MLEALGQVFEVLSSSVVMFMGFERGGLIVLKGALGWDGVGVT